MNTYKNILDCSSLQHLSRVIRDSKTPKLTYDTFSKREDKAYLNLTENLKSHLSKEQLYNVENFINEYTSELVEIYFNMGVKTGAKIMHQLLDNKDKDF
jgi:hypothetical protein